MYLRLNMAGSTPNNTHPSSPHLSHLIIQLWQHSQCLRLPAISTLMVSPTASMPCKDCVPTHVTAAEEHHPNSCPHPPLTSSFSRGSTRSTSVPLLSTLMFAPTPSVTSTDSVAFSSQGRATNA